MGFVLCFSVLSVHMTSSKSLVGIAGVVAEIQQEKKVYWFLHGYHSNNKNNSGLLVVFMGSAWCHCICSNVLWKRETFLNIFSYLTQSFCTRLEMDMGQIWVGSNSTYIQTLFTTFLSANLRYSLHFRKLFVLSWLSLFLCRDGMYTFWYVESSFTSIIFAFHIVFTQLRLRLWLCWHLCLILLDFRHASFVYILCATSRFG